jgi:hypothetical protein
VFVYAGFFCSPQSSEKPLVARRLTRTLTRIRDSMGVVLYEDSAKTFDQSLAVRFVEGQGWHILLEFPHRWHRCHSEEDARFISNGMRIAAAAMRGQHAGEETAQELDEAHATLDRNVGPSRAGSIMQASSQRCRGQAISVPSLS